MTRPVVAWVRGLATVSSHWASWSFRSSRLRTLRPEEEVLADVAVGPLHLALGLGPIGPTGPRLIAVMGCEVDQVTVVDDVAGLRLAGHHRLHTVVEDRSRHPAERGKGGAVAAQHRLQVLVLDEAPPDQPAVAEHQGEQPHLADHAGLVGKDGFEVREVDLGLVSRRRLEAHLIAGLRWGTQVPDGVGNGAIAAPVSPLPDLPQQPPSAQARIGRHPVAEIGDIGVDQPRTRLARAVDRRLQPAGDVLANRLAVDPQFPRDRRDRQPLLMQIKDHHDIPQLDHRRRSLPMRKPASTM